MEAGTSAREEGGWGYDGAAVAGAVLATIFFPLVALIAALLLLGGQRDPQKRRSLTVWAWSSAALIVLQIVVVLSLWTGLGHGSSNRIDKSGPCVGGPAAGVEGKDISGNGTKVVFPCTFGGTETVSLPATP